MKLRSRQKPTAFLCATFTHASFDINQLKNELKFVRRMRALAEAQLVRSNQSLELCSI
jgi:hypothetical protein